MAYALTFNGHDIGSNYAVNRQLGRTLAAYDPILVDVPGRAGQLYAGTRALPAQITLDVYAMGNTREARQTEMRTLAGWLAVDKPKTLILGDENGLYRRAIPTGESVQEAYLNADHAEITFVCPDPRAYGAFSTVTYTTTGAGTGTLDVTVGGTAPTAPTITGTAAGNSEGLWKLTDETGAGIYAAIPNGTSYSIEANCEARTLKVNGAVVMLPPTFDWPEWEPGAHVLTITGGASNITVSWQGRWW